MKTTTIAMLLGSLLFSAPALAGQYYYNPAFPNQPGSYNDHVRSSFNTALHSVAVHTVRDPNGNTWSGSPNGGHPGVKIVEGGGKGYKGLSVINTTGIKTAVATKLGISPRQLVIRTSPMKVTRASSIFASATKVGYKVIGTKGAVSSGSFLLVQMKNGKGGRLFKTK